MSNAEWAFFEPLIKAMRQLNGCKPVDHRRVPDGVFWIARPVAPWRDLPEEFGKWGSVYRQFRRECLQVPQRLQVTRSGSLLGGFRGRTRSCTIASLPLLRSEAAAVLVMAKAAIRAAWSGLLAAVLPTHPDQQMCLQRLLTAQTSRRNVPVIGVFPAMRCLTTCVEKNAPSHGTSCKKSSSAP